MNYSDKKTYDLMSFVFKSMSLH